MGYYNPFDDLYQHESNKHIHARTLRTNLWQKMKNTFFIFSGTGLFDEFKNKDIHVGLFDYATLGLPLLVDYAFIKLKETKLPTTRFILGIIVLLTNAVRYIAAAALTLLASPFVLATHAVSSWASSSRKKSIDKLTITQLFGGSGRGGRVCYGETTLGSLLTNNNLSMDDIEVRYVPGDGNSRVQRLEIRDKNNESISRDYSSYIKMNEKFITKNKASLEAMLELNVGHFSTLFNSIPDEAFKNQFPAEVDNYGMLL